MISQSFVNDLVRKINILEARLDNLEQPEMPGWIDWTPVVTQSSTVTASITIAKYFQMNGLVYLWVVLGITGSGVAGNEIVVSGLPFNFDTHGSRVVVGSAAILDTGTAGYDCLVEAFVVDKVRFLRDSGSVGVSPSFALASSDIIGFHATYKRA